LSREEIQGRFTFIDREFQRVDADGDGRISPEEFWRIRRFQAQQKLKKK
jgi:Ca2+-binding EF-hand superfamily protein